MHLKQPKDPTAIMVKHQREKNNELYFSEKKPIKFAKLLNQKKI